MVTSLYQSLCNMETIYADHVAIRYYDEAKQGVTEVYYRQYAQDLRRFVSFLRSKAGDVKGQRVAILARNSYHYIICMYGTVLAGGVAVPLNMGKNWDEIQYELDLVEPVCVLQVSICSGSLPWRMPTVQSWSRWMPLPPLPPHRM